MVMIGGDSILPDRLNFFKIRKLTTLGVTVASSTVVYSM